jgi:outer membrane protein TolC
MKKTLIIAEAGVNHNGSLELAYKLIDAAVEAKADIIKFTYETSVIEEKYFDILNRLNKAKIDYKNIIGELHENLNYPAISAEEFNKEKILESALVNNHNIKSYQYNYLASKSALNAEKSNFSPKVTLTALTNKQDKVVYLDNQDINSRSVSLNLSVPIFQRGIEYANVAKAKYDSEAASVEFEITRENIIKELNQALEEYVFFKKINKNNKKLFELAKNRAEIFAKRSNLKVEDPIEVIRTNIEANDRKINYIESDMNFIIAHYKIKYYLGEI